MVPYNCLRSPSTSCNYSAADLLKQNTCVLLDGLEICKQR